ncbi:MAG: hypothetical protein ABIG42_01320, partial [bacterium]
MKTQKSVFLTFALSALAIFSANAQNPGFDWAVQSGGGSDTRGYSITLDATGNQLITGYFS